MFRLLFYILLIIVLTLAASWFSNMPGEVFVYWQDYEIRTSTSLLIFSAVFVIALLAVLIPMIGALIHLPTTLAERRERKKYRHGLQLATETLAAITTGDKTHAATLMNKTRKLLPDAPITPLLQAQLAGLTRDQSQLRLSFESMLKHKETKALASRSLAELYQRQGDLLPAISHAEQAMSLEPANTQTLRSTLALYLRAHEYTKANELITAAKKRRSVTHTEAAHMQSVILLLEAEVMEKADKTDKARELLATAYRLNPNFVPITHRYIESLISSSELTLAIKILKKIWKQSPQPEITRLTLELPLEPEKLKKLARKLAAHAPATSAEGEILQARLAIRQHDFSDARAILMHALEQKPSRSIYRTLSELEIAEHNNRQLADQWLHKLDSLTAEPEWLCGECQHISKTWQALCEACGSFDRIEWTRPSLPYITSDAAGM